MAIQHVVERESLPLAQLLALETQITSDGVTIYSSDTYQDHHLVTRSHPFEMRVSSDGQRLLSRHRRHVEDFFRVPPSLIASWRNGENVPAGKQMIPIKSGVVVKDRLRGWFGGQEDVALKYTLPYNYEHTGIDQFKVMQALKNAGVPVVPFYLATRWLYVSAWDNNNPAKDSGNFFEFHLAVAGIFKRLRDEGVFRYDWNLDENLENFHERDVTAANPLERYTVIDPLWVKDPFFV